MEAAAQMSAAEAQMAAHKTPANEAVAQKAAKEADAAMVADKAAQMSDDAAETIAHMAAHRTTATEADAVKAVTQMSAAETIVQMAADKAVDGKPDKAVVALPRNAETTAQLFKSSPAFLFPCKALLVISF